MQPDHNPTDWQQPKQQPSQAPYVANQNEEPSRPPIVTLTPDDDPQTAPLPPQEEVSAVVSDDETTDPSVAETAASQPALEPVHWQAHEYIHHDKTPFWFILFALAVIGLIAAAIFVIQSITFAILVPVMAVALLVYMYRPPRLLDYTLTSKGLYINDRLYAFSDFKGFGVIHDGKEYSVMLLPVKRFMPGVSVYFPEEAGEAIVDMLGARLPMQELHLDIVDKIVRKLRL